MHQQLLGLLSWRGECVQFSSSSGVTRAGMPYCFDTRWLPFGIMGHGWIDEIASLFFFPFWTLHWKLGRKVIHVIRSWWLLVLAFGCLWLLPIFDEELNWFNHYRNMMINWDTHTIITPWDCVVNVLKSHQYRGRHFVYPSGFLLRVCICGCIQCASLKLNDKENLLKNVMGNLIMNWPLCQRPIACCHRKSPTEGKWPSEETKRKVLDQ